MTTDKKNRRETYEAPTVEVVKLENEGVIAGSPTGTGTTPPYEETPMSTVRTNRGYNSASSNDLEDLINDILTVEN